MWRSGEVVTVRFRSIDGRFYAGRPVRVVSQTDELLVTYLAVGTVVSETMLSDGRRLRDVPLQERWAHPRSSVLRPWERTELVQLFPRGRAYSLWVMRDPTRALVGWYVNLEDPHEFGDGTISTRDHVLDIWVPAETGEPEWKDEDEFEAAIATGRVTAEKAVAIRAEGERVLAERPWPTGWEDWLPPGEWTPAELPDGWESSV
jgi:hypothetical protein